jgi:hypothetical protein
MSEAEDSASRIARVKQLADRGEHQAAAREAAELIEAGLHDVRLIGFHLFGMFLQHGIAYLPVLLGRVGTLVSNDLAVLRSDHRKLQSANSATAWLFHHISMHLQFHTQQRESTWESWRGASDGALVGAIVDGCTVLTLALKAVLDAPEAEAPLGSIRHWAHDDLRLAVAQREAAAKRAAAAIAEEPPRRDERRDEQPDEPSGRLPEGPAGDPPDRNRPGQAGAPDDAVVVGSPALAVLQAKLRGFQALVTRGELAKAAVVASDVRALLDDFDPIVFIPSLFAAYFKALHQVIDKLTPYLDRADEPSWHALDSYYRADMRAFFDD